MYLNRFCSHVLEAVDGPPAADRTFTPALERDGTYGSLLWQTGLCAFLAAVAGTILSALFPIASFQLRLVLFGLGVVLVTCLNHQILLSYIRAVASNLSFKEQRHLLGLTNSLLSDIIPALSAFAASEKLAARFEAKGKSAKRVWKRYQHRYGLARSYAMSMAALFALTVAFFWFALLPVPSHNRIAFFPFLFLAVAPILLFFVSVFRFGFGYRTPISLPVSLGATLVHAARALLHYMFHEPPIVGPLFYQDRLSLITRRTIYFCFIAVFALTLNLAAMYFPLTSLLHGPHTSPVIHDPYLTRKPRGFSPELNRRYLQGESPQSLMKEQASHSVSAYALPGEHGHSLRADEHEKNISDLRELERNRRSHKDTVNSHPVAWMWASVRLTGTEHGHWFIVDFISWLTFTHAVPTIGYFSLAALFVGEPVRFVREHFVSPEQALPEHEKHQLRLERIHKSDDENERDSSVYGYEVVTRAAIGHHHDTAERLLLVTGTPGSGKTSLLKSLQQQHVRWMAQDAGNRGSMTVCDMKGELDSFHFTRSLARESGYPFFCITPRSRNASHGLKILSSETWRQLEPQTREDILATSLELSTGHSHGKGHFGAAATTTIGESIFSGKFKTFRELYRHLLNPKNYADQYEYRDAEHTRNVIRRLAMPHITNLTPELVGKDVFDSQLDISDVCRPCIIYLSLPITTNENLSVHLAKLFLKGALAWKEFIHDDTPSFWLIDEVQALFSGSELNAMLQQSRSLGIRMALACQNIQALMSKDENLFHTIEGSRTARVWFSVTTRAEREEIENFNPRVLEENLGTTSEGVVTSGIVSTDFTVDDFTYISSTERRGLIYVQADKSPFSRPWHGTIQEADFPYCISRKAHRSHFRPWPDPEEIPGTFVAASLPLYEPPKRSSFRKKKDNKNEAPQPEAAGAKAAPAPTPAYDLVKELEASTKKKKD